MTKKHFIALADAIREHNNTHTDWSETFNMSHLNVLADQFQAENPRFNRERWFNYIAGICGPNGGAIKQEKVAA